MELLVAPALRETYEELQRKMQAELQKSDTKWDSRSAVHIQRLQRQSNKKVRFYLVYEPCVQVNSVTGTDERIVQETQLYSVGHNCWQHCYTIPSLYAPFCCSASRVTGTNPTGF